MDIQMAETVLARTGMPSFGLRRGLAIAADADSGTAGSDIMNYTMECL